MQNILENSAGRNIIKIQVVILFV